MIYFIFILLMIYAVILLLRFIFTFTYYKREKERNIKEENRLSLKEVTIFQPVLSGDSYLKEKLSIIYNTAKEAELIWAVDEDDNEAEKIINEITGNNPKKNLRVIKCGRAPFYENPKVYKIIQTEKLWRKYVVILDDDTAVNTKELENIDKKLLETSIITGIPYYLKAGNIWGDMVRAYVNSNSVYNYFTSAFFSGNRTINGMFYIFKSEKVISLKLYQKIRQKLCDDYEFAKIAAENGIKVYQSVIPCKLNTEIKDLRTFLKLMRRWHVFANHYIKENLDMGIFIFSIIPFISGSLFFICSLIYSYKIFLIYIGISILNFFAGKILRKRIFCENDRIKDMVLEIISGIVQILYWILALIRPSKIIWRGKSVKIKDGIIEVSFDGKEDKG